MDEKPTADISELIQLMFVGLLGANREIEKVLKNFHEKYDRPQGFLFFECLTHQPLPKEKVDKTPQRINETLVLGPFPGGLARKSLVMIPKDKVDFVIPTEKDIVTADIIIKMERSKFTKHIYNRWIDKKYEDPEKKVKFPLNNEPYFGEITNFTKDIFLEASKTPDNSKNSFPVLHGLISPQLGGFGEAITAFVMPIASSQNFYGCLLVCVPQFKYVYVPETELQKLNELASELASKLRYCVKEYYVPALSLIHEHFFEYKIAPKIKEVLAKKGLDAKSKQGEIIKYLFSFPNYSLKLKLSNNESSEYKNPFCRSRETVEDCYHCNYFDWEQVSDNVVEKYLHKLWQDRRMDRTDINKSFIFTDRLYTDPKMLDVLEDFLKPSKAKLKKEEGKYLPSVLVVAPPGAGKGWTPSLLKLFSDCYNTGETYFLNMAALKPSAIAPVAMVGGEITWDDNSHHELVGILRKIREQTREKFRESFSPTNPEEKKKIYNKAEKYKKELTSIVSVKLKELVDDLKIKGFESYMQGMVSLLPNLRNLNEDKIEGLVEKLKKGETKGLVDELEKLKEKLSKTEIKDKKKDLIELIEKVRGIKGLVGKLKYVKSLIEKLEPVENDLKKCSHQLESRIIELLKNLEPEEKLIVKELFGSFPTIVLDELNSLSVESQGVLLRFIEEAEITPIGGCEDRMLVDSKDEKDYREFLTDFLVVGLMNEDPEEITRETAIRFLKRKDSYISGLLGDLLYEHILKIRRLRPDLRHRMMRNGKIKIPALADHRADIPVMFYMEINKAKGDFFPNCEVRINMDALEYLMRPELEWPENVRQLQSLTKKVVEIIYEDYENKKQKGDIPMIDRKDLIIVREKHIKAGMKEIGMIKETTEVE